MQSFGVIVATLLVIIGFASYLHWNKRRRSIGGPVLLPFFLHTLSVLIGSLDLLKYAGKCFESVCFLCDLVTDSQYGETFYLSIWGATSIQTIDPENIKHIITSGKYCRFHDTHRKLGNGIFAADGDTWRIQRQIAVPLFKRDSLDNMVEIFRHKGMKVIKVLEAVQNSGDVIDIQKTFMQYTIDSFGEIAFDVDFETLSNKEVDFPHYFDVSQNELIKIFLNPLKMISYTLNFGRFRNSVKQIDAYVYRLIQEKRKAQDLDAKTDLLSRFVSLRDETGKPYPDAWIRDIILNFMIAGRDTTAILLTWCIYWISQSKIVEEKILAEIHQVIPDGHPEKETIKQLTYLDNVIKEVLRLSPSVPHTGRFALEDDVFPDGTRVKAGDHVRYVQYHLHRNPKYWDRPDEFLPDRWEDKNILQSPYQYMPFHAGQMQCIGRHMAVIEAKILLGQMYSRYRLEVVSEPSKITPFFGVVMPIQEGLHVKVVPIDEKERS